MGVSSNDVDHSLSNEYFYLSGIINGEKKENSYNPVKNPIKREPKQKNDSSQTNNTNPLSKKIEGPKNFVNLPYVTKISEEENFNTKSKNADISNNNHDRMDGSKN